MTDSDNDSFHSASEGEGLEFETCTPQKPKSAFIAPVSATTDEEILASTCEKPHSPGLVPVIEKQTLSSDDSASKSSSSSVLKSEDSESKPEDGWEDFGDEADTEGDSDDVEKVESDDSEYYHRQLLDKKLMPPPPLPVKRTDSTEKHGLFDWTSISSVVSAMGEGISNVVESGLGLPPPEEAARFTVAERRKILEDSQKIKEPEPSLSSDEGGGVSPEGSIHGLPIHGHHRSHSQSGSGFSSFLGGFGSIVNGSLDVLENLGKKTFETLTVKDEAEKRRFILQPGKEINLSDILRELKESEDKPPSSPKMLAFGSSSASNTGISFLKEFEDSDGLVHLECFELLSKDYLAERVANKQFTKFDDKLSGFCLEDVSECSTDEFIKGIKKQTTKFNVGYKPTIMMNTNDELTEILTNLQSRVDTGEDINVDEFHREAILALAKLTSKAIECLCRLVQQMIVTQARPDMDAVFTFTYLVCRRLSFFASQYANLLSLLKPDSKIEEAVTNIFFECSNACLYLKKALELARPFMPDDGYIFNPKNEAVFNKKAAAAGSSKAKKQLDEGEWENW